MMLARLAIFLCLPLLFAVVVSAQTVTVSQSTVWATKPGAAAWDKIENDHLAAAQHAIDRLLAVKGPRTIENTLEPYDEATRENNTAGYFAVLMEQVHPDPTFRDHATAMLTKVSSAQTAIALNHDVYNALAALDLSKADAATKYYVQRQLLEFRLAGVDKDEATRNRIKKLNEQATEQQSMFDRNISDGQKEIEADPSELAGLPQDYIDRHKPDADGKVHLTTDYPDALPVFSFAKSNDLRKRMTLACNTRAYPKNLDVLTSLLKTRYEIATLLGYSSWADYNAADKMIEKGRNIADFIQQVKDSSRPLAEKEFQMLLEEKRKTDPKAAEIWDYERAYLSELVRRTKYDFDSQSVRPYFPFMQVKQGILDSAADLFHVSFQQEPNVPSWDPSVETWIVLLSRHASAPGQVQPRRNGAGARRSSWQAVARGDPGLQLPCSHGRRSRADGLRRRRNVLPRVRPSHAPHSRRSAAMGRDQRNQHGIRFRRSSVADAGRVDSQSASAGRVCQELQNR
jgi:thimet oligopeptidase